jgi:transketolase
VADSKVDKVSEEEGGRLRSLARKIRAHAVQMTNRGGSSHIGSVLSIADILAVLYGEVLDVTPSDPSRPDRDRFVLSKGHAGAGVYAALAESGFFPVERLVEHYQNGSVFSGHVSHKGVPGVEFSTGSLGHGLGVATGMALAGQLRGERHRVVVVMSDGECDEGSNWEAFMFAGHRMLNNLTAVIDYNGLQSLDTIENTLRLEPLKEKLEAFGWEVFEVDGHDMEELRGVLGEGTYLSERPAAVIARTTKGKGVSFMEDSVLWHYRSPQDHEFRAAMDELGEDSWDA